MDFNRNNENQSDNRNPNDRILLKNILIIRLSAMGDIVLASHAIRCLKKRFPEARITMITKSDYVPLAACIPHVDELIGFNPDGGLREIGRMIQKIRNGHFDGIVDLQASLRSRWITTFSGIQNRCNYRPRRWERFQQVHCRRFSHTRTIPVPMRYLGAMTSWSVQDDGEGLRLEIPETALKFTHKKLAAGQSVICLAPGAGRRTKMWPWGRYAEVGRHFIKNGFQVLLIGGPADLAVCEQIGEILGKSCYNFCGELSMIQSAAIIQQSALLITNDTGVMHIAAAVGTPHVAIFGPTTEHLGFFPFRGFTRIVEHHGLDCRPCSYHGTAVCPRKHFRCMLDIDSEQAITAAHSLLAA